MPHVVWLQERLKDGSLIGSGPLAGKHAKSALLIMSASDRMALEKMIADDPLAEHGMIENMNISEWDPIFGAFYGQSTMPGQMQGF